MRIAIVQLGAAPTSRSGGLFRVMRLIDDACRLDPAPDLVVIPAGCDAVRGANQWMTEAMVETFVASLSFKARDWGVCIAVVATGVVAAGAAIEVGEAEAPWRYGARLIDENGDVVARCGDDAAGSSARVCSLWFGACVIGLAEAFAEWTAAEGCAAVVAGVFFETVGCAWDERCRADFARMSSATLGAPALVIPALSGNSKESGVVRPATAVTDSETLTTEAGQVQLVSLVVKGVATA
jgi:predicted amidohydrolase